MKEFVKGRWYEIRNGTYYLKVAKCSKDSTNLKYFEGSEYINLQNNQENKDYSNPIYYNNSGSWSGVTNYREIPISEIAKYLPKGHPDLLEIHNINHSEINNYIL